MSHGSSDVGSMLVGGLIRGLLEAAVQLWPLWGLLLGIALLRLGWAVYEGRRLARSGIIDIDRMGGETFEKYLSVLFSRLGYQVVRTRFVGDYGGDLIVEQAGVRTVIQAKRYKRAVGIRAVQEAVAAKGYYGCSEAMVVTNSSYTAQAMELAKRNGVALWDRERLVRELLTVREKA